MAQTLARTNPLAQMQGSFKLHALELTCELYVSLGRGDRIKEINYLPAHPELERGLSKLAALLIGLDLKQVAQMALDGFDSLEKELLHCFDRLNWNYRHGERELTSDWMLCACHSVSASELGRVLRENPGQKFMQLQAQTGIAVTCGSCSELCQRFCSHLVATEALMAAESVDQLRLYGMTQSTLALKIQRYLDSHFRGSTLISLKGFEIALETTRDQLEILRSLQSAFETNFKLKFNPA